MFSTLRKNWFAVLLSLSVHVILFVMLFLDFEQTPKPAVLQNTANVVKAVVVDASKVDAELKKIRAAEKRKNKKEQARIKKLERKARSAKKNRVKEEKKIADLKKKRLAEEKKHKNEKLRVAKLKKEQTVLEKKRKIEQEKLADIESKRKTAQEKQKKAEAARASAEKKRKAVEAKRRENERKKQLSAQLDAEEKERTDLATQGEINKYQALIRQKVTRNWLKPVGVKKGLVCTVRVRTIPGGEVVGVKVIKGSGNAIFDRSVESAVRKAAPLPLPRDPEAAARMREIDFEFNPGEK